MFVGVQAGWRFGYCCKIMPTSRFVFAGLLMAVVGGCFEDEPEDPAEPTEQEKQNPQNPNNPNDPKTPDPAGALQGKLFWVDDYDREIHRLDLATGTDTLLGKGYMSDVASDGSVVFVGSDGDLSEAAQDAVNAPRVIVKQDFSSDKSHDDNFENPKVSPDGTKIAFSDLQRSSFVVNRADGSVVAKFEATGAQRYDRPTWTPDNRLVIAGGTENRGLFITDAALGNPTRFDPNLDLNVAYPANPCVSPDGKKVAFAVEHRIQTMNLDGTGLVTVSDEPEANRPVFSPDSVYVAYTGGISRIYIRPAAGGAAVDILEQNPALKASLGGSFGSLSNSQLAWVK